MCSFGFVWGSGVKTGGSVKQPRKTRQVSLQFVLSGLCGLTGVVLAIVGAFSLFDATSLRGDLGMLDRQAHQLLHIEHTAAAAWQHLTREIIKLDRAQGTADSDETLVGALARAKPWLSEKSWASLDELRESSMRATRRARALADRGDRDAAREALADELTTLSLARVEQPVADARGPGGRRLQDLAARAGRIDDLPMMRAVG